MVSSQCRHSHKKVITKPYRGGVPICPVLLENSHKRGQTEELDKISSPPSPLKTSQTPRGAVWCWEGHLPLYPNPNFTQFISPYPNATKYSSLNFFPNFFPNSFTLCTQTLPNSLETRPNLTPFLGNQTNPYQIPSTLCRSVDPCFIWRFIWKRAQWLVIWNLGTTPPSFPTTWSPMSEMQPWSPPPYKAVLVLS